MQERAEPAEASDIDVVGRALPSGSPHVPALDGLRGLAVTMTVMNHLLVINAHPGLAATAFRGVQTSLWLGVDLFLALSGFLITGILFDTLGNTHSLRTFYGRRGLRILPLYLLALAVLGLLTRPLDIAWHGFQWNLLTMTQNVPPFVTHPPAFPLDVLSGHLWSIALEEQFYLLWPFAVLLVRDRRHLMRLALVLAVLALGLRVALVISGASMQYTYKTLPCRMDGLLAGAWLALAVRGPERAKVLSAAKYGFAVAAALLLTAAVAEHGLDWRTSRFANSVGYSVAALAFASLLALALQPGVAARLFAAPVLRWLGRYSFGLYVWHELLGEFAVAPARAFAAQLHYGKAAQMVAGVVAASCLSVVLALLSFHLFEAPVLKLKRFFPQPRSVLAPYR